jgi:porin
VACPAAAQTEPPTGSLATVETESGPVDLPGHKPAPVTREEAKKPPAEQNGAAPTTPRSPREWFGDAGKPWFEWSRAFGDAGGLRTSLEDKGLTFAGSFTINWSGVLGGGVSRRAYSRRFFDLNATLDLEKFADWKGGSIYADFYHYSGELGNHVGDAQNTDALAVDRHLDQLAELWFQQRFFDGLLRLKVGKIDANMDFGALAVAGGFVSGDGTGDTNMLGIPTYPNPGMGALAFVYPTENIYAGVGLFDGATQDGFPTGSRGPATFFSDSRSDSWYIIGEAGVTWEQFGCGHRGRLCAGGWGHTGAFARFDGGTERGTAGGYIMAEQQLTRRGDSDDCKCKGLFGFARAAFADANISTVGTHVCAGLVCKGTFAGRDGDEAGVMWSYANLSTASGARGNEHNVELYYKLQLFGSVSITPDVQWISNPGGNPTVRDAWLGTLSVVVSF